MNFNKKTEVVTTNTYTLVFNEAESEMLQAIVGGLNEEEIVKLIKNSVWTTHLCPTRTREFSGQLFRILHDNR